MDDHTFQSRIASLAQKCKKAVRLYTSMGRVQGGGEAESSSDRQIRVWREVNARLFEELVAILEKQDRRYAATHTNSLRDDYRTAFRDAESKLHRSQSELVSAAESGNFNKCVLLSNELVVLQARRQALEAVFCELDRLLDRSSVARPEQQAVFTGKERGGAAEQQDSELFAQAKIIPLPQRRTS